MGQPQVEEDQLNGLTKPLATLDGKATLTDIVGTNATEPANQLGSLPSLSRMAENNVVL